MTDAVLRTPAQDEARARRQPTGGAAIRALQRAAGNRATGQLLRKRADEPSSVSDVPLDSKDFWTHLTTRTMVQYGRWIADTRQAVNQFVADMGTKEAAKVDWFAVMQAWIGTLGTPGDIANAVLSSGKALVEAAGGAPEGMTLAELVDRENAALQALSDKTANVKSDLPIYAQLRAKRDLERSTPGNDETFTRNRRAAMTELEGSLNRLPRPEALRQALVIAWIKRGVKSWDTDSLRGSIVFFVKFVPQFDDDRLVKLQIDSLKATLWNGDDLRGDDGIDNESGTLRALRGAYGDSKRLSELPLNIMLAARSGDDVLLWARKGATWAPMSESGGRGHTRYKLPLGSERGYEVFKRLRTEMGKATVKDLKSYGAARAWW